MDPKMPTMADNPELEFNTIMFEKRLTNLKDSQDSINACCHWCLNNRNHHKKIVNCWLNVLKRVKIEHRLVLFYLANDVIQYSKRRNYEFVESWGTTLQKATTMVRDEKVKHKILRIFKIWEQRGIYGEEFLADLCGLISASPSARKGDETHEFQSAYLIQKIKTCARLETDTDIKLKQLKEHNPKIQIDSESLISSLKDRVHVDDVEKELEDYTKQMDDYISALKLEIKARINLISLLAQAETQLDNDKKDVKLVTTAYKTFATRVKALKKKLDEKIPGFTSPIPSPDINAPSPSPDSDIELPGIDNSNSSTVSPSTCIPPTLFTNPGYYNPVPPPTPDANTNVGNNNFSSFMDSNMAFNMTNFTSNSVFGSNQSQNTLANATSQPQTTNSYSINEAISSLFPSMACPPPPPAPTTNSVPLQGDYPYGNAPHVPLMPPPMPPFSSKPDDNYGVAAYGETYNGNNNSNYVTPAYEPTPTPTYQPASTYQQNTTPYEPTAQPYQSAPANLPATTTFEPFNTSYPPPFQNPDPYPPPVVSLSTPYPTVEEYNPEEELETWEPEPTWEQPPPVELDTPESPPLFEKEGYADPVEYHDGVMFEGAADVDHRVLPSLILDPINTDKKIGHRAKDVDHRNLISLTGSPIEIRPNWVSQGDQDYRKPGNRNADQDYRVPFNIENFKLPPPPPPPKMLPNQSEIGSFNSNKMDDFPKTAENISTVKSPIQAKRHGLSPRKLQDNTESIDMDLSDDDHDSSMAQEEQPGTNTSPNSDCFELPPPFPDLFDDADANKFLDNVNEDLEEFDLECMDQQPILSPLKPGLLGHAPSVQFAVSFTNPPNLIFNEPPPGVLQQPAAMPLQDPNWMNQDQEVFHNPDFQSAQDFQNREFSFHGRGNFNNRGSPRIRGNWVNRGTNDFRGRGGRGAPWGMRGAMPFRGNWGGRGRGAMRGWIDRGRGVIRARGNFRGGF